MKYAGGWGRYVMGGFLMFAALGVVVWPAQAPIAVLLPLAAAVQPWRLAWKRLEGTALLGAMVWGGLAIFIGALTQVMAWMEPLETGRPWAGRLTYVMVLAVLAALISVLNARRPGGVAWAILMALLVLVFLIPWMEGPGRVHRAHGLALLQLDSPWTLFYTLLVVAGVTNYLPTRYGLAAVWMGLGLILEYFGLTRTDWSPPRRAEVWMAVAWCLAASIWTARWCATRPGQGGNRIEQAWFWFRDHWGVVWALRIQERFNRSAELARWPFRLTWHGLNTINPEETASSPRDLDQAETTFRGLIRRFAAPRCLEVLLGDAPPGSCDSDTRA